MFSVALVVAFAKFAWLDRATRFWALGMLLSLLSACSAVPHNRLLYFPSLGGIGLLAATIDAFTRSDPRLPNGIARKVSQVVVGLSGGLHAFVSPLLLPLAACTVSLTHTVADRAIPSAVATMTDVPRQELVMVTAPEYYAGEYLRLVQRAEGKPEPEKLRLLSVGSVRLHVARVNEHTLELTYEHGLLESMPLRLYRDAAHPMHAGDTIRLDGTRHRRPPRHARRPARDGDLHVRGAARFAEAHRDRFVPFVPPSADGETVDVEPARSEFTVG